MKRALSIAMLAIFMTVETSAQKGSEAESVVFDDGFRPGEFLYYSRSVISDDVFVWRQGFDSAAGLSYRYFPDGSASIHVGEILPLALGEWSLRCISDPITDQMECAMRNVEAQVEFLFGDDDDLDSVCIAGHDYPGRLGALRVGAFAAFVTNESGCIYGRDALMLSSQLSGGGELIVRRVEWPYDVDRDSFHDVVGSDFAFDFISFLLAGVPAETMAAEQAIEYVEDEDAYLGSVLERLAD